MPQSNTSTLGPSQDELRTIYGRRECATLGVRSLPDMAEEARRSGLLKTPSWVVAQRQRKRQLQLADLEFSKS